MSRYDNDFDVSSRELRDMARSLESFERGRGYAKHWSRSKMSISEFLRLMEDADLRRRSKNVVYERDRRSGTIRSVEITKRRKRRRRGEHARDRSSRDVRKEREGQRRRGERHDWKSTRRLMAADRRASRDRLSSMEDMSVADAVNVLNEESSGDGLEYVELRGYEVRFSVNVEDVSNEVQGKR